MMHGIVIDNTDTMKDLGLIALSDIKIGSPEPKTSYVSVPEADGDLDLTEAISGEVRYGMRQISLTLFAVRDITGTRNGPPDERQLSGVKSALMALAHGKKKKIWLPDDPEHYFLGRITIGEKSNYNSGRFQISATVEPWRFKNEPTERVVSSGGKIIAANEQRRICPVFTVTQGGASIVFKGETYTLTNGENVFSGIRLEPGRNELTFSNVTVPITMSYQEAIL